MATSSGPPGSNTSASSPLPKSGRITRSPGAVPRMMQIASRMTDREIQAVADYIEDYALQWTKFWEESTQAAPGPRDAHCAAYRKAHPERGALARADLLFSADKAPYCRTMF